MNNSLTKILMDGIARREISDEMGWRELVLWYDPMGDTPGFCITEFDRDGGELRTYDITEIEDLMGDELDSTWVRF